MATEINLEKYQRWMQALILHPGNDHDAFASQEAQAEISYGEAVKLALPSKTLSGIDRVGIYRGMYFARLHEAIRMDFDGVAHYLGEKGFKKVLFDYVQAYPSHSYNMNRLSDNFPRYLKEQTRLRHKDFLYDLARLELAICQVMEAEESPVLDPQSLAAIPEDAWERARIKPIKAFQLLYLDYPANSYLQAVYDGEEPPKMRRKPSWVLVFRNDFTVWRRELNQQSFELLRELSAGLPLVEAITTIAERYPAKNDNWHKKLFEWFNDWVTDGIFQVVEL